MGAGSRKGNSIPHQASRGSSVYSTGLSNENPFYSSETEGQGKDKNLSTKDTNEHEGKKDRLVEQKRLDKGIKGWKNTATNNF